MTQASPELRAVPAELFARSLDDREEAETRQAALAEDSTLDSDDEADCGHAAIAVEMGKWSSVGRGWQPDACRQRGRRWRRRLGDWLPTTGCNARSGRDGRQRGFQR
jgi:hypothetical protein